MDVHGQALAIPDRARQVVHAVEQQPRTGPGVAPDVKHHRHQRYGRAVRQADVMQSQHPPQQRHVLGHTRPHIRIVARLAFQQQRQLRLPVRILEQPGPIAQPRPQIRRQPLGFQPLQTRQGDRRLPLRAQKSQHVPRDFPMAAQHLEDRVMAGRVECVFHVLVSFRRHTGLTAPRPLYYPATAGQCRHCAWRDAGPSDGKNRVPGARGGRDAGLGLKLR